MKFLFYCSDFELSLKYDDKYDYQNGIICSIGDVTHLAVRINTLSSKQSISYAVFDWQEMEYGDKTANIQLANDISPDIIRFANSTIESSQNKVMPLQKKERIQSALTYCQTSPIGNYKSEQNGILINMVEMGKEQDSTWTININNKQFATLNNKQASDEVFSGLCNSICQYISAWIGSLNR